MRFDYSGMMSALDKMEKASRKESGTMLYEFAGVFEKSLQSESFRVQPDKMDIMIVRTIYGNRIRRKPGVTPQKEIARRIRAIGTFRKGWDTGKLEIVDSWIYRINYMNRASNSAIVDALKGVSGKSKNATRSKFQKSMDGLIKKITSAFK